MSSTGENASWKTPPTVENTLLSLPPTPPAIHAAIYNPNLTVEEVEAMVIAYPLCLGKRHINVVEYPSNLFQFPESVEPQLGHTPLHCAAKRCSMPLIKMLVDHGAVVDTRGAGGETPLMVACGVRVSTERIFMMCRSLR